MKEARILGCFQSLQTPPNNERKQTSRLEESVALQILDMKRPP